ncbi:MAG: S8 family serine peptidase [Saprospiraceae bacterium]|nr:S8 family serine peptidase [Candidatus Vicinibacter affinis]MBK7799168.1 S8 family serine peptidase [Candidatus Vicinibacter affinis]MBP6173255.1 S8 family serine peptidase [Saprospiraceae bacterium]
MTGFRTLVFIFLSCIAFILPLHLSAQALTHRQGELIVKLNSGSNPRLFLRNRLKARSSNGELRLKKVLSEDWNILLLEFDFTLFRPEDIIAELSKDPEVLAVQKNKLLQLRKSPNDTYFFRQWHHLNTGSEGGLPGVDFDSDLAWDLNTGGLTELGDTIVLCIIDDGLDIAHYDIKGNLWRNYQEIPDNKLDDDQNGYVDDYYGWNSYKDGGNFDPGFHGTPVCGIAAATGNNNLGVCGINWKVKLMFVAGGGDEANAILSYTYPWKARKAYNQSNGKQGAFVVATNSSWGSDYGMPEEAPIWCAVYDSLGAEGILNAASTTNLDLNVDEDGDLPTTCESDYLITVTSMDWFDQKDPTAGYGNKSIDLGAYGENVYTISPSNGLRSFSGTSAAAPQVAGAIALLYSIPCNNLAQLARSNPGTAALSVKSLILSNCKKIASLQAITVSGGVLNLGSAANAVQPFELHSELNKIEFRRSVPLGLLPVSIELRKKGATNWEQQQAFSDSTIVFNNLEYCTEYEFRIKGGCVRFKEVYSPVQSVWTDGCCQSPDRLSMKFSGDDFVLVNLRHSGISNRIAYVIRKRFDLHFDTVYMNHTNGQEILINGLLPCQQYECNFFSFCDPEWSAMSEPLIIQTNGCGQCTDISYCKRNRPQSNFEWIESISVDNVEFKTGNNLGYGNYTGSSYQWVLDKWQAHSIKIVPGFANDSSLMHMVAWLDQNQNGIFETQENLIPAGSKSNQTASFNFNIPAEAKDGYTRLRIMLKYAENNIEEPGPCSQGLEFGEYEDYCILITNGSCGPLAKAALAGTTKNTAVIDFQKINGNDLVYYQFRKLYEPGWQHSNTRGDMVFLSGLDSCSDYEIRLGVLCNLNFTQQISLRFKTTGSTCLTSTINPVDPSSLPMIYPNPFQNHFVVELGSEDLSPDFEMFNLVGIRIPVKATPLGEHKWRIDMEPLNGVCLLRINLPGKVPILRKLLHSKN